MYFYNCRSLKTNCSFVVHLKFRDKSDGTKVLYVHSFNSNHNHFDLNNITEVNDDDGAAENNNGDTSKQSNPSLVDCKLICESQKKALSPASSTNQQDSPSDSNLEDSSSENNDRTIIVNHLYQKMKLAMESLDSESFDETTMKWEKMICCIQKKVAFEVWEWKKFLEPNPTLNESLFDIEEMSIYVANNGKDSTFAEEAIASDSMNKFEEKIATAPQTKKTNDLIASQDEGAKQHQTLKVFKSARPGRPTGIVTTASGTPKKIIPGKSVAFEKKGHGQKIGTLLGWLGVGDKNVQLILSGQAVLKEEHVRQIDHLTLKDSFMDKSVKVNILKKYCEKEVFEKLTRMIDEKRKAEVYHCNFCDEIAEEETVRCDSCLIWSHFSCVDYEKAKEWFCPKCLPREKEYELVHP